MAALALAHWLLLSIITECMWPYQRVLAPKIHGKLNAPRNQICLRSFSRTIAGALQLDKMAEAPSKDLTPKVMIDSATELDSTLCASQTMLPRVFTIRQPISVEIGKAADGS